MAEGAGRISGDGFNSQTPASHSSSAAASTTTTSRVSLSPPSHFLTKRIIP